MHHFIDEAGDLSLFSRRKQVVLGTEGVSNYFMVGVAHVPDPIALESALTELRAELLADPFLNRVPSLDPARRKTAVCFHAKDDLPEVRHRVFRLLATFPIKIFVAVRTKRVLIEQAHALHRYGRKMSENDIYDDLLARLLQNRLHLANANSIVLARRGTKDRKRAFTEAIERAQSNFQRRWGEREFGLSEIATLHPSESAGLQAVDYFLWALQRVYERQDDRFFAPLVAHYGIVMDLDDTRRRRYGEWYTSANPLMLEKNEARNRLGSSPKARTPGMKPTFACSRAGLTIRQRTVILLFSARLRSQ